MQEASPFLGSNLLHLAQASPAHRSISEANRKDLLVIYTGFAECRGATAFSRPADAAELYSAEKIGRRAGGMRLRYAKVGRSGCAEEESWSRSYQQKIVASHGF